MDAAEAPVGGDLYQVRPPVAVRHHLADVLVEVQRVLAVGEVPVVLGVEWEVEEGLVKVEVVLAMSVSAAAVSLGVIGLPVSVIVGTSVLAGQDLDCRPSKY